MAPETPDVGLDAQDQAEIFDETNLDDDAEFVTLEEMPDVYDATQALGDGREVRSFDAADLDAEALDDEDLEDDEDLDDELRDDLEDDEEDDEIDDEDVDDEDEADYESEDLSDDDLEDLGYADGDDDDQSKGAGGGHPDDVPDEVHPHQDELLDEGVEETFPASDPVSVKRIT